MNLARLVDLFTTQFPNVTVCDFHAYIVRSFNLSIRVKENICSLCAIYVSYILLAYAHYVILMK